MTNITEDDVEQAALDWLDRSGLAGGIWPRHRPQHSQRRAKRLTTAMSYWSGGYGMPPPRSTLRCQQQLQTCKAELLDREIFYTLLEVRVLTERYRQTYNRVRPHSALGYRPPAPETLLPADPVPVLVGVT